MANQFGIPRDVEKRLRAKFTVCAYCRGAMQEHVGLRGCKYDKATIEHLNWDGPFYWSGGLKEEDLVICCGSCNSSRGKKRLRIWFASTYCVQKGITELNVAEEVKQYLLRRESGAGNSQPKEDDPASLRRSALGQEGAIMADNENPIPKFGTDERKPSEVTDTYWLSAERQRGDYPEHLELGGKWLLFVPVAEIDLVWDKIRTATERGLLGGSAKVATAKPSQLAKSSAVRVICVYTYDWMDEADVRRVRDGLRELGFTTKIAYKADEDTTAGNYSGKFKGRLSKYYE